MTHADRQAGGRNVRGNGQGLAQVNFPTTSQMLTLCLFERRGGHVTYYTIGGGGGGSVMGGAGAATSPLGCLSRQQNKMIPLRRLSAPPQ